MADKYEPVYMVESTVVQGAFYETDKYSYDASPEAARKIVYRKVS